jgi:hypothetical protein
MQAVHSIPDHVTVHPRDRTLHLLLASFLLGFPFNPEDGNSYVPLKCQGIYTGLNGVVSEDSTPGLFLASLTVCL